MTWRSRRVFAIATLAVVFAAAAALAGCARSESGAADSPASIAPSATAGAGPESTNETAMPGDFTIRAYQGADVLGDETVELSTIVGHGRPVVLNFWGGLCPPCRAEMPAFQRTHERFGDRVLFLGVDVGPFVGLGSRQDAKDLITELGVTYPNGWTFNSRALKDFKVYGIPMTWFFRADGSVHRIWAGAIPEEELVQIAGDLAGAP